MRKPTKAGYFATDVWEGRQLRNVPVDTPLQLNIMDRNGETGEIKTS